MEEVRQAALESTSSIPYVWLDPCRDFDAAPPEDPGAPAPPSWQQPLHTYRLGHLRLIDAQVLPVGVVNEAGWICDSVQYLPRNWAAAPWMAELAGHRLLPAPEPGGKVQLERVESWPTQRLAGRWTVLNDLAAHRNLAHFFADLLPQLVAIRRLQQQWPDLQVLGLPERYANLRLLREAIVARGWTPRPDSPLREGPRLDVDELLLQPVAFNGGVGFLGDPTNHWWIAADDLREGLTLLRQALEPDPAAVWRGHWVCFSRDLGAPTSAPQGRHFSNYPELLEAISNAGVLVIDPGRYDIRQLQLLVAEARGFVGIHGAGLMNALLARPGAALIEIRSASGCWRMLELLARTSGLDCQIVQAAADPDRPGYSLIPIDQVLACVHEGSERGKRRS